MKHSIVIELEGETDLLVKELEKSVERNLKPFLDQNDLKISHLEAAEGSLKEEFGVGL